MSQQTEEIHQTRGHQQVEDKWSSIHAEIIDRWPQLTIYDLQLVDGDSRKLITIVHQKTGENLDEIENQIDEIAANSGGLLTEVSQMLHQAADPVTDKVVQAQAAIGERIIRTPGQSLAIALGAGLFIGVCLSLTLRSTRRSDDCWNWK